MTTASHSAVRPLFAQATGSPIRAMLALAGEPGMISLAGGTRTPRCCRRTGCVNACSM